MRLRKSTTILLSLILLLGVWSGISVSASAKAKPVCPKKQTIKVVYDSADARYVEAGDGGYICIKNLSSSARIYSIKSSNPAVSAKSMLKNNKFKALKVYANGKKGKVKNGTRSTISFKVRQNNKTYTLSCKVTFKVQNPFKSLKIGNTELKKNGSIRNEYLSTMAGKKAISVKPEAGYRIDFISVSFKPVIEYDEETGEPIMMSSYAKKIKNGEIVDMSNVSSIYVNYAKIKKPTYYSKPKSGNGELFTDYKVIRFN